MTTLLKSDVLDGLADALETIDGLRVEAGAELQEGRIQLPLAQIYWLRSETAVESEIERNTFGPTPVRQIEWVMRIDVRAREGKFFGQAYGTMLALEDAIEDALEAGASADPPFGQEGLRGVRWTSEYVTWIGEGTTEPSYVGSRFEIVCRIY